MNKRRIILRRSSGSWEAADEIGGAVANDLPGVPSIYYGDEGYGGLGPLEPVHLSLGPEDQELLEWHRN